MIVFDGVTRSHHLGALQPRDGLQHGELDVLRQRGRDAVGIDGEIVQSFGLQEDLVPVTLAEPDDLVLDRGTVARADTLDLPRIHGGPMQIGADDLVGRGRGRRDMAGHLRRGDLVRQVGKGSRRVVAVLLFERGIVDRATVEPGRRARLETPQLESQAMQSLRERRGRFLDPIAPHAAGRDLGLAHVDEPSQKGARRQDHPTGGDLGTRLGDDAGTRAACIQNNICNRVRPDFQVGLVRQQRLHGLPVEFAIGLRTGPAHRRPLGKVQCAKLDSATVDGAPHDPVQRIDLADEMALAQSPDRGIARHLADRLDSMRYQHGPRTKARRGSGGFTAGMAATHHDDII